MNDRQRRRQERAERVRDLAATLNAEFTDGSKGAQSVARLDELVERVTALDASHATNAREAHAGTTGKTEARGSLRKLLSRISETASVIATDDPSLKDKFRIPAGNPNSRSLLSTARSIQTEVAPHKARFVEYGLAADFLDKLGEKIDTFEQSANRQHTGVSARSGDRAAISAALDAVDEEIARFDAIIHNKFADDPARLAAWETARRLERAPRKSKGANGTPPPATHT
jgi:hypothetical protein